jgi:hypothetical protein
MFKKIIFSSLLAFLFFFVLILGVNAQTVDNTLKGLNETATEVGAFEQQSKQSQAVGGLFIQSSAGRLIGAVLSFVGVLFLIMMIYAGIMWMTAQGNDQQVTKAKDLLINSIIGIVIIFAAYAITAFIGNFVSNTLLQ